MVSDRADCFARNDKVLDGLLLTAQFLSEHATLINDDLLIWLALNIRDDAFQGFDAVVRLSMMHFEALLTFVTVFVLLEALVVVRLELGSFDLQAAEATGYRCVWAVVLMSRDLVSINKNVAPPAAYVYFFAGTPVLPG